MIVPVPVMATVLYIAPLFVIVSALTILLSAQVPFVKVLFVKVLPVAPPKVNDAMGTAPEVSHPVTTRDGGWLLPTAADEDWE